MPAKQYPFIDIAVHERVREHFAKGEAAVLFSPDLTQVLWSNGQGASLFGHKAIYDFIDAGTDRKDVSFRQLEATAAQLKQTGDHRNFLMRISSGFRSTTLSASVEIISVYPGDSAVLFTAPLDARPVSRAECAERMLSGFDDPDTHMAVLDADGQIIAASAGFAALEISEQTSRALVGAVGQHKDWLVKRPVTTGKGSLPAAIGKLSDTPSLHLLFAVETILGTLDATPDEKTSISTAENDGITATNPATDVPADEAQLMADPSISVGEAGEAPAEDPAGEQLHPNAPEEAEFEAEGAEPHDEAKAEDQTDAGTEYPLDTAVMGDDTEAAEEQSDAGSNFSNYATAFEHSAGTELGGQDVADDGQRVETAEVPAPAEDIVSPHSGLQTEASDFVFNPNGRAMRFVWKIDADGRLTEISDEFAAAVGPLSADIVGMDFNAVAERYGFDGDGKVRELLQRRDTWSGKTILWPVQGTNLVVPVDLAALPTYSRTRDFDGFRGFGIVRVADAVEDEQAIGLKLAGHASEALQTPTAEVSDEVVQDTTWSPEPPDTADSNDAFDGPDQADNSDHQELEPASAGDSQTTEASDTAEGEPAAVEDAFRGERPVLRIVDPAARVLSDKVIQLEEHRARGREGLSAGEQAAFREIARKLNETTAKTEATSTNEVAPQPAQPMDQDEQRAEHASDGAMSPEATDIDAAEKAFIDTALADTEAEPVSDPSQVSEPDDMIGALEQPTDSSADAAADEADAPGRGAEETADGTQFAEDTLHPGTVSTDDQTSSPADDGALEDYFGPVRNDAAPETTANARPDDTEDTKTPVHSLGPDVVDYLPVALLVHNGDVLHHANPEFLKLTGYASLQELTSDGGIDALFPVAEDDLFAAPEGAMLLIRNDGRLVPVTARLQSVRWQGKSALMMALAPAETTEDEKIPVVADATQEEFFDDDPIAPIIESDTIRGLKIEIDELRSILETATDGVVTVGMDGEIRSMNRSASALFNYDEAETRGKMFAMLFAHESQKAVLDYLGGLSGHGVASVLNDGREVIGRESGGGFIPLFMTMGRLSSSNGFCAVIRDITQWKRTEEELRNAKRSAETANAHKTDFLARVSHEIRTPLNAIIGFSDMMSSERLGPIGHPRYAEYAGDIGRSGRHVLDIVNDLLDISKIEAGEMDLEFTAVGLNEMVSEAVSLVQPQANSQRVIVRTSLSSAVPNVVADSRSIKQIALNILANAIRFTPSGGQIVVSTAYEANGSVVLRIRDTGVGMTRAELEQALKPFRQVTTGTRKRGDGTGLGLPLTKAMVDANRAQFSISSTPNEGTLVEVTFPSQRVLAE